MNIKINYLLTFAVYCFNLCIIRNTGTMEHHSYSSLFLWNFHFPEHMEANEKYSQVC
jgi:hypothetical protein